MPEHQFLSSVSAGDQVRSVYFISSAVRSESRNGPYWRLELRDAGGTAEAKVWSPLSLSFDEFPVGAAVELSGRASLYKEQLQIVADGLRVLDEEEKAGLPLEDYIPCAPRPAGEMMRELEELCGSVLKHKPLARLVKSVLNDDAVRPLFMSMPAAKNVHHAYAGGLLEHSLSVARLCMLFADHYPELDRQVLLAGAVLHDVGKVEEMAGLAVTEYTGEGQMLGHLVQGLLIVEPFLKKSGLEPEIAAHLKHLIASHHGQAEFGALKEPLTAEAHALHHADDLDARMAYFRANLPPRDGDDSTYWSYMPLYRRELCRPRHAPEAMPQPRRLKHPDQGLRQASLLKIPAGADDGGISCSGGAQDAGDGVPGRGRRM